MNTTNLRTKFTIREISENTVVVERKQYLDFNGTEIPYKIHNSTFYDTPEEREAIKAFCNESTYNAIIAMWGENNEVTDNAEI